MAGTIAPKPVGLKVGGKRLWTETLEAYELRQDELVVLKAACFEVDLIDRMEKELKTATLTVKGSMGQLVPHPLVSELRQHRATLATILRGLKLPDTDASPANQQRNAAQTRWGAHGQAS
ncbi:hypothetical protein [Pseudoclavibacter sp. VKM Ac-2888]|uniref:hypothetical protein n=1 Tax=Pseudoclavibacter sp. VKM Ac-2888 TaxID=2783830 RepID=UPI00188CADCC|nr:hypothetical protein [Pseudoclavibacter sp. VKM Ac-2888]MBF4549681.1 hypothetical protein [Pseudoclavibacter sp. VKM Ac-2888]